MFYVFETATGDASIAGISSARFDTLNAATQSFHQRLSTAMKSALFDSDLVMVIGDDGAVYRSEKYIKDVPEETEPEGE